MSPPLRILAGLGLGLLVGIALASFQVAPGSGGVLTAEVVGGLWLDALGMTIVPLVFGLVVTGIASAAGSMAAGGITRLSISLFLALLFCASATAAIVAPMLLAIWPAPAQAAQALRAALEGGASIPESPAIAAMLRGIIPANAIAAAASGAMLPLVFFAVVFGFAVARAGEEARDSLGRLFRSMVETMLIIVGWVLKAAPVGVFALAMVVGVRAGFSALGALAHYIAIIVLMCILAIGAAYFIAVVFGRTPLPGFIRAVAPAQAIALSTQSSLASLPAMLNASKSLHIPPQIAGVTLPLAVSMFRIAGPMANVSVAIYVAHVLGIELSFIELAIGVVVAVVVVFGGVGVPSQVSFFTIAPILMAMGIPIEMLALLIAVESIPDIFRTTANVTMDVSVATVVARKVREPPSTEAAAALTAASE